MLSDPKTRQSKVLHVALGYGNETRALLYSHHPEGCKVHTALYTYGY